MTAKNKQVRRDAANGFVHSGDARSRWTCSHRSPRDPRFVAGAVRSVGMVSVSVTVGISYGKGHQDGAAPFPRPPRPPRTPTPPSFMPSFMPSLMSFMPLESSVLHVLHYMKDMRDAHTTLVG